MTAPALTLDFVLAATGGTAYRTGATSFCGAAIDGRAVQKGGLWFAIRGERHDGHRFASQAIVSGAGGLVMERGRGGETTVVPDGVSIIEVDDTVRALGDLGRAWRLAQPSLEVVAITGSYGKTSTKELTAAVLAAHAGDGAVLKTSGNLNNHLGLPLTLLGLAPAHRYAVIEMGMSALGEIAYLASLARPRIGVVTSVGPVHLEGLGTVDNVARAKGELFAALPPTGVAVYPVPPDGDARIAAHAAASRAVRHVRTRTRAGVEVRVEEARTSPHGTDVALRLPDGERIEARLALLGAHHAMNAAAAAAVGCALGVPPATIARGLAAARAEKHRSSAIDLGGRHILDDCYNASPPSTRAALDMLAALKGGGRAVAVLGDMLELGPEESLLHRNIGDHAARLRLDMLVTLGERARHIAEAALAAGLPPAQVRHAHSPEEAADAAARATAPGDWILVKASRGMKLEQVIEALRFRFAATQQEAPL